MIWILNHLCMAVVPDDDLGRISEDDEQQPPRSQTPPTPPVHDQPSPSPISPLHLFCLTSLQGFCSSFTLIDLKASISPSYPQTEVILMCTEPFWMIRYMNMSCSAHWYVILWMQPDTFGSINYFRYYINYINYVYYLFKMRKIDNVKSICQVIWLSVL